MSRRRFLTLGAVGIAATMASLYERGVWPGRSIAFNYWSLSSDLRDLYDADFEHALLDINTSDLLASLESNGILLNGTLVFDQLQARIINDPIIVYGNSPYAESELSLYVLVARLRGQSLMRFFS